jgi:hypothetical protein
VQQVDWRSVETKARQHFNEASRKINFLAWLDIVFEFPEHHDALIRCVKKCFFSTVYDSSLLLAFFALLDCHDNECQMLLLADEHLMDESQIEIAQGLKARFVTQGLIARLVA